MSETGMKHDESVKVRIVGGRVLGFVERVEVLHVGEDLVVECKTAR